MIWYVARCAQHPRSVACQLRFKCGDEYPEHLAICQRMQTVALKLRVVQQEAIASLLGALPKLVGAIFAR